MITVLDSIEVEVPVAVPLSTPKSTLPTTIADTLSQAATVLSKGWTTHVRYNGRGGYCALGAVEHVHGLHWHNGLKALSTDSLHFMYDYLTASGAAKPFVWEGGISKVGTVCQWNNSSNQETVVSTFREAAEAARKLGV